MAGKFWEHFSHGADIGIRGVGTTLEEAFEQAAFALTAVITDPQTVISQESINIQCEAPDEELLLVEWLNQLIYQMATRKMLFSEFDLRIRDRQLTALAWGEPIDIPRHQPAVEVKGATYTSLNISQDQSGMWTAQCVVDV